MALLLAVPTTVQPVKSPVSKPPLTTRDCPVCRLKGRNTPAPVFAFVNTTLVMYTPGARRLAAALNCTVTLVTAPGASTPAAGTADNHAAGFNTAQGRFPLPPLVRV